MSKYNDSTISFVDALDRLWDSVTTYSVSTSGSSSDNCYVNFPYKFSDVPHHYHDNIWTWKTITTTDIPKIDIPTYPPSNGWLKEDGSLFIQIACTGFDKYDLKVTIEDGVLLIRATKGHTQDFKSSIKKEWKQLFHNLATRDFEWKRRISNKYDLEKLEAKVIDGILEITIPLKEACKPVKKEIEIK